MAPLEKFGAGYLLNPLLAGGSVLLIRKVALTIGAGSREAAGTAMLALATAPCFVINAATYYSMNAHLFANLAFVALLLTPTTLRLIAAGCVGAWALSLHNPFPHFVFALPWLLAQLRPPDRLRRLALLVAGYAPLGLVLVVGWHFYRHGFLPPKHGVAAISAERMLAFGFVTPDWETLENRILGIGKLVAWSSFGLLPLAALGAFRHWKDQHVRLLVSSALVTLLAYLVVPYNQGHGWGYRYFHSAFMCVPLLAGVALSSSPTETANAPGAAEPRRLLSANVWWMLGGLVLCLPLRMLEVKGFMAAHYAQRTAAAADGEQCVHFMKVGQGETFVQDLIWNDPWLRGRDLYLTSLGAENEHLLQEFAPEASLRHKIKTDTTYCGPSLDNLRTRLLGSTSP
jgi:hypothetical protein